MPGKQVYGKRATTTTTNAFAKFISPNKDVVIAGERKKTIRKPTRATGRDERKDTVELVEKELADLNLETDEVLSTKVVKKKSGRPRRVVEDDDDVQGVEKAVDVIDLTDEMNALAVNRDKCQPQQRRRPRNALETTDEVARTKTGAKTAATLDEQTRTPRKPTEPQKMPSTHMQDRTLKAVVTPKRAGSPKTPLLPTPEPTPDPEDPYTAYVSPLLSLSYGKAVITFDAWSSALEPHFEVTKIAEASYSEVYRLTATSTTSESTNESVLKLVALKTPLNLPLPNKPQTREAQDTERQAKKELKAREKKDQWKSHVDDVHSEVKLLQNLNHIPGFTNFRELTVLRGRPSATFINAWKAWNKTRPRGKKSEFPDPSKKTSYDDTQLWAVVEMQDAGTDCEKVMEAGGISTVWEAWDVFWGVCLSVAKAEETCKFEHRDLHLENICIRSSRSQSHDDLIRPIIQDPLRRKLGFTGLDTTVIDYTLSRADMLPSSPSLKSSPSSPVSEAFASLDSGPPTPLSEREVAYLDLNKDMALFAGDASEEYQYEIYRYMRSVVLYNDPLRSSNSASLQGPDTPRRSPRKTPQHIRFDPDTESEPSPHRSPRSPPIDHYCAPRSDVWRNFHPKTNLVWAHFILHKLLEHLRGAEPAKLSTQQITRNVEARIEDSAKVAKKAYKLYKVLERVRALLEPTALAGESGLGSAKELVVLAIEERWLRVEDVAGC